MSSQIPDPFYIDLVKGIAEVKTELKGLRAQVLQLATQSEIKLHRWILGGFFLALLTMAGWIAAR